MKLINTAFLYSEVRYLHEKGGYVRSIAAFLCILMCTLGAYPGETENDTEIDEEKKQRVLNGYVEEIKFREIDSTVQYDMDLSEEEIDRIRNSVQKELSEENNNPSDTGSPLESDSVFADTGTLDSSLSLNSSEGIDTLVVDPDSVPQEPAELSENSRKRVFMISAATGAALSAGIVIAGILSKDDKNNSEGQEGIDRLPPDPPDY